MVNKIMIAVKREGFLKVLKEVIRFKIYLPARRIYNIALDRYYKIDTEEIVSLNSLNLPEDAGERCEPTPISEFLKIMRCFNICPNDVFLDMGSGKGRTALLAGRYPFKKIIGVDISEKLNEIAECNVKTLKQKLVCKDYEFVTSNALDYKIPSTVTYVYFFNPFSYQVLNKVLRNIEESIKENPRNVTLIYYNPKYSFEMERDHKLIKIESLEFSHWSLYKSKCYIYQFAI